MEYSKSLKEITDIRKANLDERLTKLEMKEYHKVNGKLNWLAQGTRSDLSFTVLQMSKRKHTATIANLCKINKVLKESKMYYGRIGKKEKFQMVGIGDFSFKTDEKVIGGEVLLLLNQDLTRTSPIYWKTKQFERVCHSSKDAETLNLSKLVEDAVFAVRQLETLLFGEYTRRIPIHLFTDLEGTLESLASTK